MAAGAPTTDAPPAGIAALAERWDPEVIDLPDGRAVIRLRVPGAVSWDARVRDLRLELAPADEEAEPDARDRRRLRHLAADRGGSARRDGRLPAATPADARQPARGRRLPGRDGGLARARPARLRAARDGRRAAVDRLGGRGTRDHPLPARPRRHQGLLPADRRRARRPLPRRGTRPAGLRRIRQADRRALRRAVVRPRDLRRHGRARARLGAPCGQQHGRSGGDRSGADRPGAGALARPDVPRARLAT